MKHLLNSLLLVLVAASQVSGFQDESEAGDIASEAAIVLTPRIEDGRTGQELTLETLVEKLSQSDVVFLGEQHNNDSGHEFQLQVIKGLFEGGHSIAISTEQFERDVQGSLNDYLGGAIDEDAFLASARPWRNYKQHYKPIVEFAKANRIPVLAGNIPRRIASAVSAGESISFVDQPFVPRQTSAHKDAYWEKFKATMEGHLGVDGEAKLEKFFASQCMKDDAMAETISDFIAVNSHKPKIVVHLCGRFHSDFGLGTVSRLVTRQPLIRTSIVTMELQHDGKGDKKISAKMEVASGRAHFVFQSVSNK